MLQAELSHRGEPFFSLSPTEPIPPDEQAALFFASQRLCVAYRKSSDRPSPPHAIGLLSPDSFLSPECPKAEGP